MGTNSEEAPSGFLRIEGLTRRDGLWLILMSLMLFVLLLPISSYIAVIPFLKVEWGLGNLRAGAIYSAYTAGYVLSVLFVVPATDRLGAKRVMIGSSVVSVVAHVLFPLLADNVTTGAAIRAVAGVGLAGVYMPGVRVVMERLSGVARGAATGVFVTAYYAAYSGSLAITGALLAHLEWRDAYLAVSLAAAASLPLVYVLLRGHHDRPNHQSSGRLDIGVLGNPPVRYLVFGYSVHALQLYAVRVWLPAYLLAVLVSRGVADGEAAFTSATVGGLVLAVGSVGPMMGGFISDHFGRAISASAVLALSGTCAWFIGWTGDLPWGLIIAISVVYGWGISADSAIYTTGVTEVAYPMNIGSTLAMHAFLGYTGSVIGPILFGGLLDMAPESYEWGVSFSVLGALAIVAIFGLQRLRRLPRSRLLAGGKG